MSKDIRESLPNDKEALLGIMNDSRDMLEQLYKGYFPMILNFVLLNSGTDDDAKDVFQESMIVLYDKVKEGKFELNCKLKTFIYSVSRRIWLKKLSYSSRYTGKVEDFEDTIHVEDDIVSHEEKDLQFYKMDEALNMLGEPCKTIIEDFYLKNRSMQEISEKFGYTNSDNAKNQKYKCLQRLKRYFFSK